MKPFAAVPVPVAVVATGDDVHQAARRQAVRIIVDAEQPPEGVHAAGVRIPEPGGKPLEFRAVGPAAIDVAPFAAAGQCRPVAADQLVVGPQVLTEADKHVAPAIKGKTGQPVVRIVAGRIEVEDTASAIGHQITVVVPQRQHLFSRRHQHRVGLPGLERCSDRDAHRVDEPVGKHGRLLGTPITVAVTQNEQTVGRMPIVTLRREMRVALDREHPTQVVDVQASRSDDVRVSRKQLDHQPGITARRWLVGSSQPVGSDIDDQGGQQ